LRSKGAFRLQERREIANAVPLRNAGYHNSFNLGAMRLADLLFYNAENLVEKFRGVIPPQASGPFLGQCYRRGLRSRRNDPCYRTRMPIWTHQVTVMSDLGLGRVKTAYGLESV
jgi:hypothetical protein